MVITSCTIKHNFKRGPPKHHTKQGCFILLDSKSFCRNKINLHVNRKIGKGIIQFLSCNYILKYSPIWWRKNIDHLLLYYYINNRYCWRGEIEGSLHSILIWTSPMIFKVNYNIHWVSSSLAKGYDSGPPSLHPWRI